MNIKMTMSEFDEFIMLYLKDKIESIDEIDTSQELFLDFVKQLDSKSFWPILNRVQLDVPMIQRVNTNRIIEKKEKSPEGSINILM